jgi:hypothetical protein
MCRADVSDVHNHHTQYLAYLHTYACRQNVHLLANHKAISIQWLCIEAAKCKDPKPGWAA